jgi:hypothetical protein
MIRWVFRDYVHPNGKNRVRKWCLELSIRERAKLDRLLMVLAQQQQWREPQFKPLSNVQAGLGEIRWNGDQRKQLRLLGCHGPKSGQYTLLLGCNHKDNRYSPTSALETAAQDLRMLEQGIGVTCEHEIESDSETEEEQGIS